MSKDNDEIISVKVAGAEYQLYCPKDEQRGLLNAADYLNKKVRKIKITIVVITSNKFVLIPKFKLYNIFSSLIFLELKIIILVNKVNI